MFCVPIPCRAVPRYGPRAAAALCGGEAGAVAVAASAESRTKGKSYIACFGDEKAHNFVTVGGRIAHIVCVEAQGVF